MEELLERRKRSPIQKNKEGAILLTLQFTIQFSVFLHMILKTRRNSEKIRAPVGFEPTTLRVLVGCSNHWATGTLWLAWVNLLGLDWNRITRLHSQVMTIFCSCKGRFWREIVVDFCDNRKQDALGAYTCTSSWIKCESFWFYWVLTVYARLGFSVISNSRM